MSDRPLVLLLNPPGRRVYLRDYFCSKVSQADYINHPIDLVYLSAFLNQDFRLALIDAIVDRLGDARCLSRIEELAPDIVVGLIGSVSYQEDVRFYRHLSRRTAARIVLIGDVLLERREQRLQELPFIDAFLHDFSTEDLPRYLKGNRTGLANLIYRYNGAMVATPLDRKRGQRFELPLPRHDLFVRRNYRYPFVRRRRFATVMTEVGCPYRCTFCIMATLGWRIRPVQNVLAELEYLDSLGVRELLLLDQTFGIQKDRARELLKSMARLDPGFGWVCFSRPDVLDDELLGWMKAAGCHTIILGVESGNEQILESVKKDYGKEDVRRGFRLCARHGLRTVATLILGLPEETHETFAETMAFLRELDPDFASFNVAVPRLGTPFRATAMDLGLASLDLETMDQSGSEIAMPSLTLTREQIKALKRKAIREFYFDSRYFKKRLRQLAQPANGLVSEWKIHLKQGYRLLKNYLWDG